MCLIRRRRWRENAVSFSWQWQSISTVVCYTVLTFAAGCHREKQETFVDHPRLTPLVTMHDVTFHSSALQRDTPYRAILPRSIPSGSKLPVVYYSTVAMVVFATGPTTPMSLALPSAA